MSDIIKPQTLLMAPRLYFDPLVCHELDKLDGIAEVIRMTVVAQYNPDHTDVGLDSNEEYLLEREHWNNFVNAAEDTCETHRIINPSNRSYDYHWCMAHLALYETTKSLLLFIGLNGNLSYVGDTCLAQELQFKNPSNETAIQFRSLAQQVGQIETAQRQKMGVEMPKLSAFTP